MIEKLFANLWYKFWEITEFGLRFFLTLIVLLTSGYVGISLSTFFNLGYIYYVITVLIIIIISLILLHVWMKYIIKPLIPKPKKKKRRRDIVNQWLNGEL